MNQSGTDTGVACFAQKCAVLNQVHFTDPTTSKDDIVYESPTSYLSLPQGSCCVQSPLESLSLAPHLVTGYQSPLFCFVCIALRYQGHSWTFLNTFWRLGWRQLFENDSQSI